jgi:hypothetical protein
MPFTCSGVMESIIILSMRVFNHCRKRAPVRIDLSSSGTSQLGMFDIQATTKSKNVNYLSITEYMRFLTAIVYSSYFPLSMKFYIVYCKY